MMRNNSSRRTRVLKPQIMLAAFRGYQDATAGRGFDRAYELVDDRYVAMAYERARLWVCNMRAAGVRIPAWNKIPANGQIHPHVKDAVRKAADKIGSSVPDSVAGR